MNTNKAISAVVDQAAVTAAHMAAARRQMVTTKSMQEVKETVLREVLTSEKFQEGLGKIINKLV